MLQHILLPVDVRKPKAWGKALDIAVNLARQNGATLHVLFVAPKLEHNLNKFPEDYRPALETYVKENVPADVSAKAELRSGSEHREICAAAKKLNCDLIVMGSHDPELKDALLGSNASAVVLHAPTSVYVVR
ncbi:MAG: universal stress protein [Pseudomonadota bacterium]